MTTDQMSIFDSGPSRQRYRAVLAQAADDAHLTLIRMEPTGSPLVLHQKDVRFLPPAVRRGTTKGNRVQNVARKEVNAMPEKMTIGSLFSGYG